jgi:methyl-accepting chemotaxis protein
MSAHATLFAPAIGAARLLGCHRTLLLLGAFMAAALATLTSMATTHAALPSADLVVFDLLATLLGFYFLTGFYLHIRHQLEAMRASVNQISHGDFNSIPTSLNSGVIGALENEIARMGKEYERMVTRITQSASETHCASRAEAEIAQRNAAGASRQAAAISEVATAIEQMAASVGHVTEQINTIKKIAEQTQHSSSAGETVITTTIDSIQGISSAMRQAIDRVNTLGQRSDEISQIIDVIKGIANQTNLLALNAAIEAARAGEHGRGFAVVSDEVRQLAIRTHDATERVSAMISTIQGEIAATIDSISQIDKQVSSSIELSDTASHHLQAIREGATTTVESMHTAASAITQQSQVCDDIAANIDTINQMAAASTQDAIETQDTALYLEALSQRVLSILPRQSQPKGA